MTIKRHNSASGAIRVIRIFFGRFAAAPGQFRLNNFI